ncbi:MAG: class I SAM-dependent methyltransferase [Magnetococcales bacterium]|nr:class I SAM-dependent methyltransferase [Magnetococcales bacterium]
MLPVATSKGGIGRHLLKLWIKFRSPDPLIRFEIMRRLLAPIFPGYRFPWPQLTWWHDSRFNAYLSRFGELNQSNSDRRWNLYQMMRLLAGVEGDTAECGVFRGCGSWLIAKANAESRYQRQHYIFDTFAGLSEPGEGDGGHWIEGDMACDQATVERNLIDCSQVHFLAGYIPDRFMEVAERRFALVHIDVDLYDPTLKSLEFFYPRLNPGAVLVCDDYGSTACPGATSAVDEFMSDKPEKMIALSSGGGFFIRGVTTSPPIPLPDQ